MSDITSYRAEMAPALIQLWRDAAGDKHPLPAAMWEELTLCDPSFRPDDLLVAVEAGLPIGFALTKRFREPALGLEKMGDRGWIALMAVSPRHQRQGVGTALLAAAEAHLKADGAKTVSLGESFHHALPGIPDALPDALAFFTARGYQVFNEVWDVRGDVAAAVAPQLPEGVTARPVAAREGGQLLHFLEQTFPGRWARDMAHLWLSGEPLPHVMGLFDGADLVGFAQLHPPGSRGALRWAGFDRGVAGLGPIGVSEAVRGRGLGLALLQAGLARLRELGAGPTVIDWTTLLDFYGRAGFRPWLHYRQARKELA